MRTNLNASQTAQTRTNRDETMNSTINRNYQQFRKRGHNASTALDYARNIHASEQMGWEFIWEGDSDADLSFVDTWNDKDATHQRKAWKRNPPECEGCILNNEDGEVLASLWGIIDADQAYQRDIAAELAVEADAWNIYQQLPDDANV
jgi:hypothetical protein